MLLKAIVGLENRLTGDPRQPQQVMDSTEGGTRRTITLHIFSFNSLTPRKEV